jgi:succinate-acetate transporter protein
MFKNANKVFHNSQMLVYGSFWLILAISMLIQGPEYQDVGKYIFLFILSYTLFMYRKFID